MDLEEIRLATEEDIPRILELYADLAITTSGAELSRSPSHEDYRRVLAEIRASPGHELLVVQSQGEVVGTMALITVPNLSHNACAWAIVENLVIAEKHRRRGLGRLLMEYAITKAREAGCHKLVLTSDKRRVDAHRFYRSMGLKASAHGFRLYF